MFVIVIILIFLIFIVGIPIGISFLIYQRIKKSGFDKKYRFLAIIPLIIFGCLIYTAIYPNEDFYKTDFKEVTDMEFPKSGKIIYKTASYPDQFGDYTSSFLVELDKEYITKLKTKLNKNKFFEAKNKMSSNELDYIEKQKINLKYSYEFNKNIESGKYYSIGILNDNKSVIITRISW